MTTPGMLRLRQLRRAKDLMDREWSQLTDIDEVARHAGYSTYHFTRVFRAAYGEAPGQYLSRRRIERACEILRTANLSVTQICTLVGFHSLGTFSATFKKQTGLSPTAYRDRYLERGAALIPGCYALLWAGGFRDQRRSPVESPQQRPAAAADESNSEEAD